MGLLGGKFVVQCLWSVLVEYSLNFWWKMEVRTRVAEVMETVEKDEFYEAL